MTLRRHSTRLLLRPGDMASRTVREVRELVEKFERYPDVDLFDEFA